MSRTRRLTKSQIAQDWVRKHSGSSGTDRFVLLIFAYYVNDSTGLTYPAIDPTIMQETGMSRSAVFRAIKRLENLGELKQAHRRFNQSSLYEIVGPMYGPSDLERNPISGTSSIERNPTGGTSVPERNPILGEKNPASGTLPLKTSKEAAAAKRIACRMAGRRKLEAEHREGSDALAATIGREDFGSEIDALIEAHPDWTGEQVGEAVKIGPSSSYYEPVAAGADKTPNVTFCDEHRCYLDACPPNSGHRWVYERRGFLGWRLFDPELDRGTTYTDAMGSVWEICACNNGSGADCERCGNSGSILVGEDT